MKSTLLAALAVVLIGSAAQAETMSFPADAPVASVTFPDDWESSDTGAGATTSSPDGMVQFYLDIADGKSVETVVSEAVTFLQDNGVTIDAATQWTKDGDNYGKPITMIGWDGTDESGPATIQVGVIVTGPDKALVFTYWGTKAEELQYDPQIQAIMKSITPVE